MKTCPKCETELKDAPGIGQYCPNKDCDISDNLIPFWQMTGDKPYKERYDFGWHTPTSKFVVQECIDVIMNSTDRHRKEYFADLLKKHFEVDNE